MRKITLLFVLWVCSLHLQAQSISASSQTGEATIQKSTPQVTSIATGEPFAYTIDFQNLNPANTLTITDLLPAGLCYTASDITADNTFIDFNGNPVSSSITGLIDTSSLPAVVFSITNNIQRGSFTINVTFCAGITADGFTATNNITADYTTSSGTENFGPATGLVSTASAVSPWGKISKTPLFPAVTDQNGNFFIPTTGGTAQFNIIVEKDPAYQGISFGMLNLQNPTISEIVSPPCATATLISGPGTLDPVTNIITLNNDLIGSNPFENVQFIVEVDYSNCPAFTNGQVIPNTVELNGTPVGESPATAIATDTATVTAVDNLPPPTLGSAMIKSVFITNPVAGCQGAYDILYSNSDNRPVALVDIIDNLPNDIIPQSIRISGLINSASSNTNFDLIINGNPSIPVDLSIGYNGTFTPAPAGNSLQLGAQNNTLLFPGDQLNITIIFTVDPALTIGTSITNCSDFQGEILLESPAANVAISNNSCASFTIAAEEVKLCAVKKVRKSNTGDPYQTAITNIVPTDELDFEICIQNNGSLDFNGVLTDVLDPKYEFISVDNTNMPAGTTFTQNGQNLTWSAVNLVENCSAFFAANTCLNTVNQSFCAVVKVRVKPYTVPGNIDNVATITDSANNLSVTTDFAKVNVIESVVISLKKQISDDDITYQDAPLIYDPTCNLDVYYRLIVENFGNKALNQFQIIDELPAAGDVYYPTVLTRNSSFSLVNYAATAPDFTVSYLNSTPSTTVAPNNFDCNTVATGTTSPSPTTQTVLFENSSILNPADSFTIDLSASLPSVAVGTNSMVSNSAYLVNCDAGTGIIIPSNRVELTIDSPIDQCEPLDFLPYQAAVGNLFPLAIEHELDTDRFGTLDKEYGDMDNDGDTDILYTKIDASSGFPVLHWLENTAGRNTTPIFNLPPVNMNIQNALSYRLYDWNNNGCLDLVVYGVNTETRVYYNDCAGNFSYGAYLLLENIDYPFGPALMEVGDLNNDGLPDIILSSQNTMFPGTAYFENNGSATYPYFDLVAPQGYTSFGTMITNIYMPENGDSYPTPELYDTDCDGDLDLLISDPLLPGSVGGRMYFHENTGGTTSSIYPNINTTGVSNQFGLNDTASGISDLRCDWVVTRIVDYYSNGCPIAISYNPCERKFFYYDQDDCGCATLSNTQVIIQDRPLKLYPNPTTDQFFINGETLEDNRYIIYDLNGRKLSEGKYRANQGINCSNFKAGLYFIAIENNNQWQSLKFVKK
ncbi:MAG: T9SS type A sorting domain-containing protein [Nonlabens sp.]|uniref:T9SS type A sorting domain-containing protein n=1 Tax=Nonlabens sp. TaxID=1888209 RepID=UPI003EFAC861